ncbi:MAG: histone deacetylase [Planctomycetota bacterium]
MHAYYCDYLDFPRPEHHRFPLDKYRRLRERLEAHPDFAAVTLAPAPAATPEDLLLAHTEDWVEAVLAGTLTAEQIRRIGFPWSPDYVRRSLGSVGGTLAALESAFATGWGGNLAGGTHHAHRGFGAGYCCFNDLAVAARRALGSGRARRVLVLDLDVHHGDGTAAIFAGDDRVFTASVHGERNFPRIKPEGDLDLALPDGAGDGEYLAAVERALSTGLDRSGADLLLYQAGVDPLATDRLGRLAVSPEGLALRDATVFEVSIEKGLPVVVTIGGGYSDPIEPTVAAHAATYLAAARILGSGR